MVAIHYCDPALLESKERAETLRAHGYSLGELVVRDRAGRIVTAPDLAWLLMTSLQASHPAGSRPPYLVVSSINPSQTIDEVGGSYSRCNVDFKNGLVAIEVGGSFVYVRSEPTIIDRGTLLFTVDAREKIEERYPR